MVETLKLQLRNAPSVEPLSLDDAKQYLRVTGSDDDAFINSLIVASRDSCENFTHRALITQEWTMWLDNWDAKSKMPWWDGVRVGAWIPESASGIELPKNPVQSVDLINSYDDDNTATVWATTNYFVDIYSIKARVNLTIGGITPVNTRPTNGIEIQFKSGYGDAPTDIPNTLLEGMKAMIGHMYENRGCSCEEAGAKSSAFVLWRPYVINGMM